MSQTSPPLSALSSENAHRGRGDPPPSSPTDAGQFAHRKPSVNGSHIDPEAPGRFRNCQKARELFPHAAILKTMTDTPEVWINHPDNESICEKKMFHHRLRLDSISGGEWLRLLLEMRLDNFPEGGQCEGCRSFCVRKVDVCPSCGQRVIRVDWEKVSNHIKRAWRNDRKLLSKVKADYVSRFPEEVRSRVPTPDFHSSLGWLKEAWERTGKPRGRPVDVHRCYKIANEREDPRRSEREKGETTFPDAEARERKRISAWVKEQRENPAARLSGKRIRTRKEK